MAPSHRSTFLAPMPVYGLKPCTQSEKPMKLPQENSYVVRHVRVLRNTSSMCYYHTCIAKRSEDVGASVHPSNSKRNIEKPASSREGLGRRSTRIQDCTGTERLYMPRSAGLAPKANKFPSTARRRGHEPQIRIPHRTRLVPRPRQGERLENS